MAVGQNIFIWILWENMFSICCVSEFRFQLAYSLFRVTLALLVYGFRLLMPKTYSRSDRSLSVIKCGHRPWSKLLWDFTIEMASFPAEIIYFWISWRWFCSLQFILHCNQSDFYKWWTRPSYSFFYWNLLSKFQIHKKAFMTSSQMFFKSYFGHVQSPLDFWDFTHVLSTWNSLPLEVLVKSLSIFRNTSKLLLPCVVFILTLPYYIQPESVTFIYGLSYGHCYTR